MKDQVIKGIPVLHILPGSPSEKAGVKVGDRILIMNGCSMNDLDAYSEAKKLNPKSMTMTIQRGNRIFDVEVPFDTE